MRSRGDRDDIGEMGGRLGKRLGLGKRLSRLIEINHRMIWCNIASSSRKTISNELRLKNNEYYSVKVQLFKYVYSKADPGTCY